MATYARRFILNNVRVVGGCCGTTPEHIRQIKSAVRTVAPALRNGASPRSARVVSEPAFTAPPVPRDRKSRLARALLDGRFVTVVELVPPHGFETQDTIEHARQLKEHGVDAVNIPDGQRTGARLSALSLAVLVEQQAGIETLLHYSCRDRNLLGIQSDLLGAHAMGLRNLMLITGDPSRVGEYPDATAVFDVDSIGLTNVVSRLNRGCDVGGQAIGAPTGFHIGVSINPAAPNLDEELRRFEYKVEAGAEFVVTRPIFDVDAFETFLKRIESAKLPVIAGIFPFEHARHAEFMANEVPGVRVPESLLDRMRRSDGPEAAAAEGVAIARHIAQRLRSSVQGIQISTGPMGAASALAVIDGLR
jgi:homocysteine S-methyltransferase